VDHYGVSQGQPRIRDQIADAALPYVAPLQAHKDGAFDEGVSRARRHDQGIGASCTSSCLVDDSTFYFSILSVNTLAHALEGTKDIQ
jgi:hypothetical protein